MNVKVDKVYDYILVGNDYYRYARDKMGRLNFVKQDRKLVELRIKKAKEMAKKLKDGVDGEKILVESLMTRFQPKEFDELYKMLFKSKINYKPRTREHHCVDMKVGNVIIPIVD